MSLTKLFLDGNNLFIPALTKLSLDGNSLFIPALTKLSLDGNNLIFTVYRYLKTITYFIPRTETLFAEMGSAQIFLNISE
jgi:hypothetical protein